MMEWERPLMQAHADLLCGPKSGTAHVAESVAQVSNLVTIKRA